ncbi:CRAL-TRIO domain-containing protein [Dunaliella salina]|uniref:CRAL-TRIO domain-containing protein n=1 Tax=Dunaliella salina TaxID=3046 RepID=A0ABQ7G2Y6_DUNSA|nr:CRAL-TRIO domain-containing protein [Dunaliella salina]|eukprot:KAF5828957.1 CRAL-TRIO domain-containing protein [Dunaliella salina]
MGLEDRLDEAQRRKLGELLTSVPEEVDSILVKHGEEGVTTATCLRWLRARKWDVKLAKKEIINHAYWRQAFLSPFPGHKHIPTSALSLELERQMVFMLGTDLKHHPTVLVYGGKHVPQDVERTKRFISYTLDATINWGHLEMAKKLQHAASQGIKLERDFYDGKAVGVFDLSDFGYANSDLSALKAVFDLLQNHYVERLYRMYLYCAPMLFYGLWKVVAPLIDPKSKEKVDFVDKSNVAKRMTLHFSPESLPQSFGGSFKPIPIHEIWRMIEEQKPELRAST